MGNLKWVLFFVGMIGISGKIVKKRGKKNTSTLTPENDGLEIHLLLLLK